MKSNKNKINIIIQARLDSNRLPNKVMKYLEDKIVLQHVYDRLKKSKYAENIIIATTNNIKDKEIIKYCQENKIKYYVGSENNVLERYYLTAKEYNSDIIVRVTSDCPLVDIEYIDKMIEYFLNKKDLEYLGPKYYGNHKFPDGFNGEVFTFKVLEEAYKNANENEIEHVTTYIIKKYKKEEYKYEINYGKYKNINFDNLHLSLDTEEDYNILKDIFKEVYLKKKEFKLEEVLEYIDRKFI